MKVLMLIKQSFVFWDKKMKVKKGDEAFVMFSVIKVLLGKFN